MDASNAAAFWRLDYDFIPGNLYELSVFYHILKTSLSLQSSWEAIILYLRSHPGKRFY